MFKNMMCSVKSYNMVTNVLGGSTYILLASAPCFLNQWTRVPSVILVILAMVVVGFQILVKVEGKDEMSEKNMTKAQNTAFAISEFLLVILLGAYMMKEHIDMFNIEYDLFAVIVGFHGIMKLFTGCFFITYENCDDADFDY